MTHTVYENPGLTHSDILTLIDDAMKRGDREVAVYINNIGTTVKISPTEECKPMWIRIKDEHGLYTYSCPECHRLSVKASLFCPDCGEKLYGVKP